MTEQQEDKLRTWLNKSPEELLEVIEFWEGLKAEKEKPETISIADKTLYAVVKSNEFEAYKELCEAQREYITLHDDSLFHWNREEKMRICINRIFELENKLNIGFTELSEES